MREARSLKKPGGSPQGRETGKLMGLSCHQQLVCRMGCLEDRKEEKKQWQVGQGLYAHSGHLGLEDPQRAWRLAREEQRRRREAFFVEDLRLASLGRSCRP